MATAVVRLSGGASGYRNEKRQYQRSDDELDASWEEELQRRPEVRIINKYAVVMAYIRIGLKGVGALALLWATVVLLGGFVSKLKKIDFWFLTSIAFVQAAGLSDAMGDDRFTFFGEWIISLTRKVQSFGRMTYHEILLLPLKRLAIKLLLVGLHIIMFVIFAPAAYFAVAGPVICLLLSALRVGKQDYVFIADGNKPDPDTANLKPALNLFYYVSFVHSAIYILYMAIELVVDEALVEIVSRMNGLSPEVLDGYLHETKRMCVNSPAATESWSLITYGAGLLDSHLPEDYASGGRVLAMLIDQDIPVTRLLIRSPRQRIQKLIGTLAWRSPAEREMRWFAARIVEHLAGHLNLAHFPGALECISSLFDTSCHNNGDREALCLPFVIGRSKPRKRRSFIKNTLEGFMEEDEDGPNGNFTSIVAASLAWRISMKYIPLITLMIGGTLEKDSKQREDGEQIDEDLVLPGLRILENLAHDRHNCTLIYNTKNLLSRVVAPVSSNKLVEDIKNNAAWTKVVDGSLKVVSRLMGSPGSTGDEIRSRIADDENAVNNLEAVLDMNMKSNSSIIELQMRAIEFLTQLVLHHPANSVTGRREKLVKCALNIFTTKDWMEDYLKDEKRKIDELTSSQENALSRPSMRAPLNNLVREVNGARKKEKKGQRAAQAHAQKKMKEAKESARRLTEKAGEALAMLSSDSEAIKTMTGRDDALRCLTELLDSKIKTIECEIGPAHTVEIEINTGCRISAAVILKNLSNYVKEPTLRKVLEELLPIQAEVSSTPSCWEHITGCITAIRNDIENPSGGSQVELSALWRQSHIQQCAERRLQAELLSLLAAIRSSGYVDFAETLKSLLQPVALEDFVVRLKKMVEDNMYATPACLAIQKLACQMVIEFIPHDRNTEDIEEHNIVGTLLKASERMAGLESSMLFAGVDRDCHGVPLRPLSSDLAKQAEDLLTRRMQELGIDTAAPAGVA